MSTPILRVEVRSRIEATAEGSDCTAVVDHTVGSPAAELCAWASVVEAEAILQEARAIAFELGTGEEYLAWTGPVVMVRW